MKNLKQPILSALVFFSTLVVLSVGYAAWTGLSLSDVDPGDTITATLMQGIVNKINDIGTRTDGIYSSGGKLGIGVVSPSAVLQVNGDVRTNQVCDQNGNNCHDLSKKMPGSVYFRVYQTVAQSIPNSTTTTIIYNYEEVDNSNSYNPATGIFTIPTSGFYHFDASIVYSNTDAGQVNILIYSPQKGYVCYEGQDAATITITADRLSCSGSAYFNVGDTVYVNGLQNAGAAKNTDIGGNYNNFSGYLVSQ